ncbi:hypothetical protein [Yersinia phage vB_Yru_GN1]|uniref:Uncharacterized protein n=1 Tax=Yersinia phage vB_Yru_GN1 TaxID=3074381 RepID=A0AA86J549_9CAUD|nr:hypothetical protein [Yersinia phage vB_Yru_GN1]
MIILDKVNSVNGTTTTTVVELNTSMMRNKFSLVVSQISESDTDAGSQSLVSTLLTKDELIQLRDAIDKMVTKDESN